VASAMMTSRRYSTVGMCRYQNFNAAYNIDTILAKYYRNIDKTLLKIKLLDQPFYCNCFFSCIGQILCMLVVTAIILW